MEFGVYYDQKNLNNNSAMAVNQVDENNILDVLSSKSASGDAASQDLYYKYLLDKLSENSARSYNASREDNAYQRLMSDLRKAGISPYALTPNLTPINGSSGFTASGNTYTSAQNTKYSKSMETASKLTQIITSVFSAIAVAMIMAA